MKTKTLTSKLLLALLAFGSLALSGCGPSPASSAAVSSTVASSAPTSATSSTTSSVASSSSTPDSSSVVASSALPAWVDYAHDGSVALTLDYQNHTFANDGVEQVTLKTCIDGDTAHFNPVSGTKVGDLDYIKARFYGIDTPESTGKVQPYGRGASDYTKAALKKAQSSGTIVLSSPSMAYGKPTADSTGSRYVSLVWINPDVKNAPYNQLYLLNLMIVQDGWSWVKNVLDMPTYSDTFYAAQTQSEAYKLNLYSGLPDPRFNYGNYQDVSILDLKREVEANMADSTHENAYNNANVRVCGTVAGFANKTLYLEDFCLYTDENGNPLTDANGNETGAGEYAGINIFVGMSTVPSKYTTINAYLSVCGNALDSENFGFQISGASFQTVPMKDSDARVLIEAEDNVEEHALKTLTYTSAELNAIASTTDFVYPCLNCSIALSDQLTITSGYTSEDGEITLNFGLSFSIYITYPVHPDPDDSAILWTSHSDFIGHRISLTGVFAFHKATSGKYYFQVNPSSSTDAVVMDYVRVKPASYDKFIVGTTRQFNAAILPIAANADQSVTWSIKNADGTSDDEGNATYATIDSTGLVTALKVGSVIVTATPVSAPSLSGSYTIKIVAS
jgi:endonuclease YncB( thermonuclease family)